jgi:hypothetical protein
MSLNKVATSMKSPAEGSCQPGCRLNCEVERTDREAKRNNQCIRGSIAAIGDACLCTPQRLRVECKEIIARQVRGLIVLCRLDKAETSLLRWKHCATAAVLPTLAHGEVLDWTNSMVKARSGLRSYLIAQLNA